MNLGALLSLDQIETIQNLSVIIHDSRSTFQGIRAKTISIYLKSEALYVNLEYENVSLSNEMAIIKTILDNRAVDNVTIMIPEAPDMAAVPIIKSLYADFFDDGELEFWVCASETQARDVREQVDEEWKDRIRRHFYHMYAHTFTEERDFDSIKLYTTVRNWIDHGVPEVMVEDFD